MPKRTYTQGQRAEALELYRTDGPTTVEDNLGIPKATVSDWAKAAGVRSVRNENAAARVEAASLKWEERRVALCHRMGAVAEKALARAEQEMADGHGRDAQAFTTTMAILIDKAQLLSGDANMRVEHRHVDALDAELQSLTAQLETTATG